MVELHTKSSSEMEQITELDTSEEDKSEESHASLRELYQYLDGYHKVLFVLGTISALCVGPFNALIIGVVRHISTEFNRNTTRHSSSQSILRNIWSMGGFSVATAIFSCIYFYCFYRIGQKTLYEYKWRYLKALLQQETEWYDERDAEELPSIVNSELKDIEFGSGKAFGFILFAISLLIFNYATSFYMGTVLACCLLVMIPIVAIVGGFYSTVMVSDAYQTELRYRKSGADAEQALGAIKVVKAFGQEDRETREFNKNLKKGNRTAGTQAIMKGLASGMLETLTYTLTVLCLFIGSTMVREGVENNNVDRNYRMGDVDGCFYCSMFAIYAASVGTSNAALLSSGLRSCHNVNSIINREPQIKIDDPEAEPVGEIAGSIRFENVEFCYKTRSYQVLKGVSLEFKKGEMTALVGASGSGKSTIVKLVERFYDPDFGAIYVNDRNLKQLNLRDYRNRIGYVGQEPFLFNQTIKENLLNAKPDATDEEIDQALKDAMAYDFVQKLPKGIDSDVGAIGSKISGGQKQRIAIARALLRKPDVLILDEATSALDKKNERSVQRAIYRINREFNITTIVIAHRLSTIKNADNIYTFEKGKIRESGTHDELMLNNGPYFRFYTAQDQAFQNIEKILNEENKNQAVEDLNEEIDLEDDKLISPSVSLSDVTDIDKEELDLSYIGILQRLYKYNRPKIFIAFCFFGAIAVGTGQPCIAIPQMKLRYQIIPGGEDSHEIHMINKYCGILLLMAITALFVQWFTRACMAVLTQNMMQDLRIDTYDNLIHQPIEFFDRTENATGNLTGVLAADMKTLNGASVENYFLVLQAFAGLIASVAIAFAYTWVMGTLTILYTPVFAFSCYYQMTVQVKMPDKNSKKYEDDKLVISESIVNQSTVSSLACDEHITKNNLHDTTEDARLISVIFAFTWFVTNFFFFLSFLIMAWKLRHGGNLEHMYIAQTACLLANMAIGVTLQNAPDWSKGKESANKIIRVLESPKEGTPESKIVDGDRIMTPEIAQGDIVFKDVWFRYPTSARGWILKNFCLTIPSGQSIGIAGESGCGKSTLVQLLLRFYSPQKGSITIGGISIDSFTLKSLRAQYGLVQQEPLVFNTTILDNICYGRPGATTAEIRGAADTANASKFILELIDRDDDDYLELAESDVRFGSLCDGYRVLCGVKGNKLSGGQKQRTAIARAIVRNPKILLLDEATSSLDEASQAIVQEALDKVMATATSLVIAHRLSTLSKCHRIVVLCDGVVVEDGTFKELAQKNGIFAQFMA